MFYRQKTARRISQLISPLTGAALLDDIAPSPGSRIETLVKPFQEVVPRSPEDVSTIKARLIRAGYRHESTINIFYASKVLVPGLLCLLATVTQLFQYGPCFVYALSAGLGFIAPEFWLSNRITARQMKLRLGLPEALDLIVVCVEAGLSMDKATMRTAEELRISQPEIADELNLVYLEQRAGRPRAEAWKHLSERTGVDTIRSLASILIQADKFGTSIGRTLRSHAETLRARRRQNLEELAAKTTVKLVFPLVLFIFPSLFVVTLGPSMIIMLEGFAKYLS
jgi:tight adherence protein C